MKMPKTIFRRRANLGVLALVILSAAIGMAAEVPDLKFADRATGETLSLDHWDGQILVLDFFAYWCAPCRPASEEIEHQLARRYANEGHPAGLPVTVLAVNIESARPGKTQAFIDQTGITHAVDDPRGAALEALKARGLPFLVVLDGTGEGGWEIVYSHNGLESIEKLRGIIDGISVGEISP
jgi:thiol-disulfide isomerase/thioredoxin